VSSDLQGWVFERQKLEDIVVISPPSFGDDRGWFMETYNQRIFESYGLSIQFVQDNISFSRAVGTVRGLHYQSRPFEQDKLVRVVKGRILDVAVDVRLESPTFGEHVAREISADDEAQMLVPKGFAHGFVTRQPDTIVTYKVSNFYSREHDHNIFWDDPEIGIDWGISSSEAIISKKDSCAPLLRNATPLL